MKKIDKNKRNLFSHPNNIEFSNNINFHKTSLIFFSQDKKLNVNVSLIAYSIMYGKVHLP